MGVISIRILCLSYPYIIESTDSMIKRGMGEDSAGEGCMFCGSVPLSLSSGGGGGCASSAMNTMALKKITYES